ncbi:MAG: cupin domain-containing protein [Streptomycetales bacterium]
MRPTQHAVVVPWPEGTPPTEDEVLHLMGRDGLHAQAWGNAPGDTYGWHEHGYHKTLYCIRGSIVFHTPGGDLTLRPGDRMELRPGTPHGATVGPDGVRCAEAPR